ncbi:MAG: lipoprotein insertase outer membrane protein LolB [Methylococcales bacterium]
MIKRSFFVIVMLQLVSCANMQEKPVSAFDLSARENLYSKTEWSFTGRIVIFDKENSMSANLTWKHTEKKEKIILSGLFGMGKTRITLTPGQTEIESEGERAIYYGDANSVIYSRLGIQVPVTALKFWVLGLVDPDAIYLKKEAGFEQYGWKITYLQMKFIAGYELPRKIRVEQDGTKVKLIVSQWDI